MFDKSIDRGMCAALTDARIRDAILVVTDIPAGVEFGINCMMFDTGVKFRGVRDVPASLTFAYHSCGMGPKQGFFLSLSGGDIKVTSWDPSNEEILPESLLPNNSLEALHNAVKQGFLMDQLGPYPTEHHHTWRNLTCYISSSVLKRAKCETGVIIHAGHEEDEALLKIPGIEKNSFTEVQHKPHFCPLSQFKSESLQKLRAILADPQSSNGLRAQSATAHLADKSALALEILRSHFDDNWKELLGELQSSSSSSF